MARIPIEKATQGFRWVQRRVTGPEMEMEGVMNTLGKVEGKKRDGML
jgi:hypothetical protein